VRGAADARGAPDVAAAGADVAAAGADVGAAALGDAPDGALGAAPPATKYG